MSSSPWHWMTDGRSFGPKYLMISWDFQWPGQNKEHHHISLWSSRRSNPRFKGGFYAKVLNSHAAEYTEKNLQQLTALREPTEVEDWYQCGEASADYQCCQERSSRIGAWDLSMRWSQSWHHIRTRTRTQRRPRNQGSLYFTKACLSLHHTLYIARVSARNTDSIPINTNANVIVFINH
jgi:hypothetical protein